MKKKLWLSSLMLLTIIVLATACGQKQQTGSPNNGKDSNVTTPAAVDPQKGNEQKEEQTKETIDAYFTDEQIMDLKKESKEISYKDKNEKYIASLKALQSANDDKLISLWTKVIFKSAEIKDGLVTVDITLPNEARLGSGGESLAIDALKNTLFQFSEVTAIDLLVDGVQVDTLMGHVELEHPMKR